MRETMVPPALMRAMPLPVTFWIMGGMPPQQQARQLAAGRILGYTLTVSSPAMKAPRLQLRLP